MTCLQLPPIVRVYVLTVMAAGVALGVGSVMHGAFDRPLLLLSFIAASMLVHTIKVELPVGGAQSTISMGFAVTFSSRLVLGGPATIWTIVAGGWAQCTINTKEPNPWYRTAFTVCSLVVATSATAAALVLTGGNHLDGPAGVVVPSILLSALVY